MLQTNKVFIDTQCYVKAGLHFEGAAFEAFYELCTQGDVTLITTSVVEREVKCKIDDSIKDALQAVQTIQRKARIIKNIDGGPLQHFFRPLEIDGVYDSAMQAFSDFLEDCNAEYAPLNSIDIEAILNCYFDKKPPFGDGKKKSEFPDAISLNAVEKYLDGSAVYVISEDEDLKSFCEGKDGFYQIDTLDKFLDIYNSHENSLALAINRHISDNMQEIKALLEEKLNDADAYNSSTWEDSELEEFKVLEISEFEPSIISIDGESCVVTFDVTVSFEVTVSGPDFTNGYWDSEDKVLIPMGSARNVVVEALDFSIEMSMDFEIDGDNIVNVEDDIQINDLSRGIEFSVEENNFDY